MGVPRRINYYCNAGGGRSLDAGEMSTLWLIPQDMEKLMIKDISSLEIHNKSTIL